MDSPYSAKNEVLESTPDTAPDTASVSPEPSLEGTAAEFPFEARESSLSEVVATAASEAPPARSPSPTLGNALRSAFFFSMVVLTTFCVLWIVGPRLVEEYYYAAELGRARAEYDNAVTQLNQSPLGDVSMAYQLVAQRIRPSVVSIETGKLDGARSIGSGVIFSSDGYIVTNAHVAKNSKSYRIELYNHHVYRAQLVGLDSTSDLAVLKIEAPDLIPAEWGDSEAIDVGSMVWAIGSPFRLKQTITSGVLSGKDRPGDDQHQKQSLLQTDAAVNPGNSGGPLVDIHGKVIGINLSILGERFQGISFAVPSSTAKFVYQQLVEQGEVKRGYLGVVPKQVDQRLADRYELANLDGARLTMVSFESPAWMAGVRQGDIVLEWNGTKVKDYRDLYRFAERTEPNTEVELVYLRRGVEKKAKVIMGHLPAVALSDEPSEFSREM